MILDIEAIDETKKYLDKTEDFVFENYLSQTELPNRNKEDLRKIFERNVTLKKLEMGLISQEEAYPSLEKLKEDNPTLFSYLEKSKEEKLKEEKLKEDNPTLFSYLEKSMSNPYGLMKNNILKEEEYPMSNPYPYDLMKNNILKDIQPHTNTNTNTIIQHGNDSNITIQHGNDSNTIIQHGNHSDSKKGSFLPKLLKITKMLFQWFQKNKG